MAEGLGLNAHTNGQVSQNGASGLGHGSPIGTDPVATDEAARRAEQIGHPAKPY